MWKVPLVKLQYEAFNPVHANLLGMDAVVFKANLAASSKRGDWVNDAFPFMLGRPEIDNKLFSSTLFRN